MICGIGVMDMIRGLRDARDLGISGMMGELGEGYERSEGVGRPVGRLRLE